VNAGRLDVLQDVLARVVAVREWLDLGDYVVVALVLADLEDDLAGVIGRALDAKQASKAKEGRSA
jgi:hypothetical protein